MAIPRKLRKQLNDRVLEMEETDFLCFDPEVFEQKLKEAITFLDSNGVNYESEYRERLRMVEEKVKQEIRTWAEPDQEKQISQQVYSGIFDDTRVKVCLGKDAYSIRRSLERPEKVLRWTFNSSGRLENIDNTSSPILKVIRDPQVPDFWIESKIFCYPISQYFFGELNFKKNDFGIYVHLIKSGHDYARSILTHIKADDIKEPRVYQSLEISLRELANNPEAMQMLKASADIFPYIKGAKRNRSIHYTKYKR